MSLTLAEPRCRDCGYRFSAEPRTAENERVAHMIHGRHNYRGWTAADAADKRREWESSRA